MTSPNKEYGLIFPNKNKGHQIGQVKAKPSIFAEDSDSDTPTYKPTGISKGIKKQDQINQEKAVEDDPTVYQYDEIYDEMDQKRKESKLSRKDLDRKPKYINRLMAAAEKRKRENERRIERQVQKEREEEGEMYKDKESFITAAYKKKLEEMKELEEQEKREEYLETIGDVRKQGNLDGFYRHLYDQKVNYEDKNIEKQPIKEEPKSDGEDPIQNSENDNPEIDSKEISEDEGLQNKMSQKSSASRSENGKFERKIENKQRKYRTRRQSEESDKGDNEQGIKKEHMPSNLDADSDFSIDSSDSEEDTSKKTIENDKKDSMEVVSEEKSKMSLKENKEKEPKIEPEIAEINKDAVKEEPQLKIKRPKLDIWKKVTVGEKYDEAVKRYFERKALREMEGICF